MSKALKLWINGSESTRFAEQSVVKTKGTRKGETVHIWALPRGTKVPPTHPVAISGPNTEFRIGLSIEDSILIPLSRQFSKTGGEKYSGQIFISVDAEPKAAKAGIMRLANGATSVFVSVTAPSGTPILAEDDAL